MTIAEKKKMDGDFFDHCVETLSKRGVELEEIAKITYDIQYKYIAGLNHQECIDSVKAVIRKREAQFAIMTGIEIDRLSEEGHIQGPLAQIIKADYGLYGIDEILALSITNIYGSIGLTNFGFLDKTKPGLIGEIDRKSPNKHQVNTFLDDLICAIAAAAASRLAHQHTSKHDY